MLPAINLSFSKRIWRSFWLLLFFAATSITIAKAQFFPIDNNGCVSGNFAIDAGLYSNILEYGIHTPATASGTKDWFFSAGTGLGVIDESDPAAIKTLLQTQPNPTYERRMSTGLSSVVNNQLLIDALWSRDYFGGTGGTDLTAFKSAKNGENPAIWGTGPGNVLGKSDLIDVAAHMFRDGTTWGNDLWVVGLINRAEPGGDAYLDFEFFVEDVDYSPSSGFTSGGPQLGHTAFVFYPDGSIKSIGDYIFNVSLTGGGSTADVEMRLWVSRADYNANLHPSGFNWGTEFDGAFSGSPYGYASIVPNINGACGIVNLESQNPLAPPWGTRGTKSNKWETNYIDYSVVEMSMNLTAFGIDHASLMGGDPCTFPFHTFIAKSRTSGSFSSALKDFAGPFEWGQPTNRTSIIGNPIISCLNSLVTLTADPIRPDIAYSWATIDGEISGNVDSPTIQVSKPGTYVLHSNLLSTGCPVPDTEVTISIDLTKPFLNTPTFTSTVSCNGNNGTIDLTITGGKPPYSYSWTKNGSLYPSTNQYLTDLSPGTYVADVTDLNGCSISSVPIIVNARNPVTIVPAITNAKCFGAKNGAVNLTISGGKTPLTYIWSTGNASRDLLNVGAGVYSITITDADGCVTTGLYTITQPPALNASIFKTDDANPNPATGTGTADLTLSGGTPVYTYNWVGPEGYTSNNQNLIALKYGQYTVTITDANNCSVVKSDFIYEPELCNDGIDNDGDGLNNCDDEADCKPAMPGNITASDNTPCTGQTITYLVPLNATYTSYEWSVPSGATISSGQGTNSISVVWNMTNGGQICVYGKRFECLSSSHCISVTPHDKPLKPGDIILNNN